MKQNIMPIFREKSDFLKKYLSMTVPEMLSLHGFVVYEMAIDDEDVVYIEKHKQFLMSKGIVDVPIHFKKEFVAEYPLKYTSIFVEGQYLRKPSGEKMYGSYYYYYYKKGFHSYKGKVGERVFAEKVNKQVFLKAFENNLGLLGMEKY